MTDDSLQCAEKKIRNKAVLWQGNRTYDDAVAEFHTYRNLQRRCAVPTARVRLLVEKLTLQICVCGIKRKLRCLIPILASTSAQQERSYLETKGAIALKWMLCTQLYAQIFCHLPPMLLLLCVVNCNLYNNNAKLSNCSVLLINYYFNNI